MNATTEIWTLMYTNTSRKTKVREFSSHDEAMNFLARNRFYAKISLVKSN